VSYPGTAGYTPRARLSGTIEEARRLLEQAGYPGGRGMPPIELLYNTSEAHRSIAEAIQAMWRTNLGVDLRLANQEWAVYLDMTEQKNFQLARAGWIADYVHPNSLLEIWEGRNGNNHTNWANPEFDQLYQEALATPSEERRYEVYQRMDEILVEDLPLIPIYHYTRVYAMSPRVRGVSTNLLDNHPYKYIWLADE
jgi:oligopeptide transport system substrate-binding protein